MARTTPRQSCFGLRVAFHSLGISCLTGAVFLELLVFLGISAHGAFIGIERNPFILNCEIGLAFFSAIYLLYVSFRSIRQLLHFKK